MNLQDFRHVTGETVVFKAETFAVEGVILGTSETAVYVQFEGDSDGTAVNPQYLTMKDPELLPAPEKIRFAERLIRNEHRVLADDYLFWGKLADHLNFISHVPEKSEQRTSDWRQFNTAQDLATGYIRMSAASAQKGKEGRA